MKTNLIDPRNFVSNLKNELIGYDTFPWDSMPKWYNMPYENYPPENRYDEKNFIFIELALAGWSKNEIKIERSDNKLEISGSKEEKEDEDSRSYFRQNIARRSFIKSYTVSNDFKDISATFKDGMLKVTLTKPVKEIKIKQIEIQ